MDEAYFILALVTIIYVIGIYFVRLIVLGGVFMRYGVTTLENHDSDLQLCTHTYTLDPLVRPCFIWSGVAGSCHFHVQS